MKNLLFGLIATATFVLNMNAQANTNNPYDYVGKMHNEIVLDFLRINTSNNMSINDILTKVKPVVLANSIYKAKYSKTYYGLTEEQVRQNMPDVVNNFKNTINTQNLTTNTKNYLNELLGFIVSTSSNSKIYSDIVSFENRVSSSKISQKEKELVLGCSSIGRYSSNLWLIQNPTPNSNSNKFWTILGDIIGAGLGWSGGLAGIVACGSAGSLIGNQIDGK